MNITQLHKNVNNVIDNLNDIILSLTMESEPSIVELNKEQMFEGETNEGKDIRPKYSENPYFKSKKSADKYAEWKMKITPGKRRKKDVPNLFIKGDFYDSIYVEKAEEYIESKTNTALGQKVTSVHKNVLGLNKSSLKILAENIKEPLINKLKDELTKSN
jgi:hypothetical protein